MVIAMFRNNKKAVTLVEVIFVIALFSILMIAAYRLFFAEVRTIKTALEHIGVNESARKFFAYLGNDIRNSNWVDYPKTVQRQVATKLKPISEGKVCVLRRQVLDLDIKPPQGDFICEEIVTYTLKKADDGTSDLYRHVVSNLPHELPRDYEKKICDGIVDMMVFTTTRKPITISKSIGGTTLSSQMNYEPYELDGTGPYLVHVYASFARKGAKTKDAESAPIKINTCFAIRGKFNGIHP